MGIGSLQSMCQSIGIMKGCTCIPSLCVSSETLDSHLGPHSQRGFWYLKAMPRKNQNEVPQNRIHSSQHTKFWRRVQSHLVGKSTVKEVSFRHKHLHEARIPMKHPDKRSFWDRAVQTPLFSMQIPVFHSLQDSTIGTELKVSRRGRCHPSLLPMIKKHDISVLEGDSTSESPPRKRRVINALFAAHRRCTNILMQLLSCRQTVPA